MTRIGRATCYRKLQDKHVLHNYNKSNNDNEIIITIIIMSHLIWLNVPLPPIQNAKI